MYTNPWFYVFASAVLNAIATLLLKRASSVFDTGKFYEIFYSISYVGAGVLFAITMLLLSKAMHSLPIAAVYPTFTGIVFILISFFSYFIFGEKLNAIQYVGIFTVFIGLFLIFKPG